MAKKKAVAKRNDSPAADEPAAQVSAPDAAASSREASSNARTPKTSRSRAKSASVPQSSEAGSVEDATADESTLPRDSAPVVRSSKSPEEIEARVREFGRMVWNRSHRRRPSIFERRWWDDRLLDAAMTDESLKVQMFRFVDVLPRLKSHQDVTRHLQEYFDEVKTHLPWAVELVKFGVEHLSPNSVLSRALAFNARSNAARMAKKFIAGESADEVVAAVTRLREEGFAFTLDLLGEAVISEDEADAYQQRYLELIDAVSAAATTWSEDSLIDRCSTGPLPRVQVSLKLSALVSHFRPIDPQGSGDEVKRRLREILRAAMNRGAHVHVDMEQHDFKPLVLQIFREVLEEDEFRRMTDVGVVLQAYLKNSERDVAELADWARRRGAPVHVRLVKGAYWDYETVTAASRNWTVPVYERKWESDASYERCTKLLLESWPWLKPAFGSHNVRSLSHAVAQAEALGVPSSDVEIQMLYGMAGEQAEVFRDLGNRVRIYTPFGKLIPGMAYLVRRLLENTSNDSFLKQGFADHRSIEDLLMTPAQAAARSPSSHAPAPPSFLNEPLADFSQETVRRDMAQALEDVESSLGESYAIVIGGKRIDRRNLLVSRNPSRTEQVVGRVASATPEDALLAVDTARRAFVEWSRVAPSYRAEYLDLIARELRERRFELAAWEVYEVGKPWAEADADVAEAIDFCVYYAQQMRLLADPQSCEVPGEENSYFYRPRGVAVVIAPWNFPLAILCGMTAAALVTGNTVVMKPAEQASVVAAKFMEVLQAAGVPDGVVNLVPGVGEEIGPTLVESPEVDLIAFTGSRTVGLNIVRQASETRTSQTMVKRVIAEMGGKNAIIVDGDADLDEAVLGVAYSAFGYAGQKCSACSRVIVLNDAYDEFLARLIAAAKSWKAGPAEDPGSMLGPVIDADAVQRIEAALPTDDETLGRRVLGGDPVPKGGCYVGPQIYVDVPPLAPLAQDELFAPVLAVFRAKDMSEAIQLANTTRYALTAGIYSRSPANLRRARQELQAGNVYLNRPITGALVARQPFGGYKLSGCGAKAGGPDYLKQFLTAVNVTENTLRRGFAPPPPADERANDE